MTTQIIDDEQIKKMRKETEKNIELYFNKNNIPFFKNIKIYNDQSKMNKDQISKKCIKLLRINFCIPGAIIMTKKLKNHDKNITKLMEQLDKATKMTNNTIYWYDPDAEKEFGDVLDKIKDMIPEEVLYITKIEDIKFTPVPYYCTDTGVLRSFASEKNTIRNEQLKKYNKNIWLTEELYNKSIIIMNETELKNLKLFEINVVKNEKDFIDMHKIYIKVYIKDMKASMSKSIFKKDISDFLNIFYDYTTPYSLKCGFPHTHIEGVTKICSKCKTILWLPSKKCRGCEGVKVI